MKVLGAVLMLICIPVLAQTPKQQPVQQAAKATIGVPGLRQEANLAFANKDYLAFRKAMVQLHRLRPNNSEYMYQLVLAHALMDEKSAAFNIMLQMQRQGLSYDFNQSPESANIRETQLYDYLNELMISAGEPVGTVTAVTTLAPDVVRALAIAWDAGREAFLVGTVSDGSIRAVAMDGTSELLIRADESNRIWGIYDFAVDPSRNRLWASSAANAQFSGFDPVDRGRSVLLEFELESMELIRRYPVPVDGRPHSLGNMALAPNGDLYVADSILPMVYVRKADQQKLKPYYTSKNMVSLRGLDISDDGKMLYVADYEMGIAVIDLELNKPYKLSIPETLNLGGIDGLNYWAGHLVVIQNGIKPQRIMSLQLDESGRGVSNVAPLAVALELMDYPNYGTVVGDVLYFFANSHWGSKNQFKPVTIASTVLSQVPEIIAPDMKKFLEDRAQMQERPPVKND